MVQESVTGRGSYDFRRPAWERASRITPRFSIAPLLIIVIAIAGFVWGQEAASGYLYAQLCGILGDEGTKAVQRWSRAPRHEGRRHRHGRRRVLLVVGATTVFAELQSDLDRIWKAPAVKKTEGLWGLIRSRMLSLGLGREHRLPAARVARGQRGARRVRQVVGRDLRRHRMALPRARLRRRASASSP
jgi:hypothetical protein